jgi:predicted RNA-binding Zn-ribbon protein involved in translation (DUF1610 family)
MTRRTYQRRHRKARGRTTPCPASTRLSLRLVPTPGSPPPPGFGVVREEKAGLAGCPRCGETKIWGPASLDIADGPWLCQACGADLTLWLRAEALRWLGMTA